MKKGAVVLVSVLFLLLLIINVYALEKSTIFGRVNPKTKISLLAEYINKGENVRIDYHRTTDEIGDWNFLIICDNGTEVNLEVNYKDIQDNYVINCGEDLKVDLLGLYSEEEVVEENTTIAEEPELEENESNDELELEENQEDNSVVTGKATFSNWFSNRSFGTFEIVLIIFGIFVLIIVANLVSYFLLHLFTREKTWKNKEVRVVKLSHKLAEQKKKEEEEAKKEAEKERKIQSLKEELEKLESGD